MLPVMLLGTGMAAPDRRKRLSYFLVFLVISGCMLQAACDAGSINLGRGGTPPGNYQVTITGTASSTEHTATVSLTVQ
jgi:hypothetical protein